MNDDCLFCKIVAGDIPGTKVAEDERTVAFMDINPATRGHLLVVPRDHSPDESASPKTTAIPSASRGIPWKLPLSFRGGVPRLRSG